MKIEIKFRALCNVDCKEGDNITKMVYFSQLELDNGLWFNPDDDKIYHINEWLTKPMQFTGLKDKNGVDIYEGDIVKNVGTPKLKQVAYHDQAFYLREGNAHTRLSKLNFDGEIIGNIHEHKHLLK